MPDEDGDDADMDDNTCDIIDVILHKTSLDPRCSVISCQRGSPSVEFATQAIDTLLARLRPACFKVGITGCPLWRFYNRGYGYFHLGFTDMVVLHAGRPCEGQFLERALIALYSGWQGLQNHLPGGENPPPGFCFTYAVASWGPSGSLLKAAARRRRMSG